MMWGNPRIQQDQGQGQAGANASGYKLDGEESVLGQYAGGSGDAGILPLHQQFQRQQMQQSGVGDLQQQQELDASPSSNGENSLPWSITSIAGSSTIHCGFGISYNNNGSANGGSTEDLSKSNLHQSHGSSYGNATLGLGMENHDQQQQQHQAMPSPTTTPIYLQSRPSTANGYRSYNHSNPSYANFNGGCNLIINYIPQFFTDRNLYDLFLPFGIVISVKVMRDRKSGYSFGFGFVNYEKKQAAHAALVTMNGRQVQNKRLKVSYARPASEEIKNTNLYITSIPRHWNEEDLFNLFAYFGEIVHLNLLREAQRGESRGVAFVRFAYRWEADKAIKELHLMKPQGVQDCIKVRLAEDHGKQKAAFMAGFELATKKNFIGRFRNQPFGLGWNTPEQEDQNLDGDLPMLQTEVHPVVAERRQRRLQLLQQQQQYQQQLQQQQQQQAEFQSSFPMFSSPPPGSPLSPPPSQPPSQTPRTIRDQSPSPSIYFK